MTERSKKKNGRPTDWTPELGDRILDLMSQGLSLAAAAAECDIHRQRVYEWKERHPCFADTIKLAMAKRQAFLERRLLNNEATGPVITSTIFALKNAAAEDWREKQELDLQSSDGSMSPTKIEIVAVPLPDGVEN